LSGLRIVSEQFVVATCRRGFSVKRQIASCHLVQHGTKCEDVRPRVGIISLHLLESDPALSKPLTEDAAAANPGAGDWFVLIDATSVHAVPKAAARILDNAALKPLVVTNGIYRLLFDLAKSDLPAR